MNQTPVYQQPTGQQRPAVSKWLWITLIIVVLIGGGFFAWYFLMGPDKASTTTATTTTTPKTTDPTANWKTYSNSTLGFSFKYPTDWTIKEQESTTDKSTVFVYSATNQIKDTSGVIQPNVIVGYINDLTTITSGSTPSATDFVASGTDTSNTVTIGGKSGYWKNLMDSTTVFVKNNNSGVFFTLSGIKSYTATTTDIKNILSSFKFTTATSADWKAFSNTAYGFGLTLTNAWQKYRYQIVLNQNGATATIYFSLPTTDAAFTAATTNAPAGYAPVFHINAFPVATYSANSIGTDTFITKSTKYDFTWGKEATVPTDVAVQAVTDEATIISSFKLSQ